ncbi:MAG: hypothetical protein ABH804_02385 [archaeon]
MVNEVKFPREKRNINLFRKVIYPLILATGISVLAGGIYFHKAEKETPVRNIPTIVYTIGKDGRSLWDIANKINNQYFNGRENVGEIVFKLGIENKVGPSELGKLQPGRRIVYSSDKQ